ncbi:hypothetical protein FUA23_16610 [Neolewinella aurantiaca]|uniref:Uncharacterized protein n=1 Tax=Neolewinella aurantiaca TaxID=2602767 RepID=A0A5C7FEQ0_9BACT|nr:hypothetical protein [Neolewinella aurantiaca]TXF87981.1 hypothetical protein FUA23_16610 [Neolewinella aurantiaca]
MLYLGAFKGIIFSCILGFLSSCFLPGICSFSSYGQEVVHHLTVFHPGMKQAKECLLVERKADSGHTLDFRMEVESVICLNGLCKVVDVGLIWDKFGNYHSLELAKGVELEKKDGTPFDTADYDKLHRILKDKNSVFQAFELGQIVDLNVDSSGIDGISGATILTDKAATVEGAAWTCYTLWHWANSEIRDTMFEIAGHSYSDRELLSLLPLDSSSVRMALVQLEKRSLYDEATIAAVVAATREWETNNTKLAINYLNGGPKETMRSAVRRIFSGAGPRQRVLFLKSVLHDDKHPPEEILSELPYYVPLLNSYEEVNLLLSYLSRRNISDDTLNELLLNLLAADDFIIARGVYWFLSNQALAPDGKAKVEEFGRLHSGRL